MRDHTIELLGNAPIGTLLWKYSLPAVVSMAISAVYSIIASVFIGRGVGALGLSALAVNFPLFNLVMGFCMMVGVGGATLCSLELGRGNTERASLVLGQVTLLGIAGGVLGGVSLCQFINPILSLFGASDATLPYAREFMMVLLMGLPASFIMISLNNLMRASGHPGKALLTMMVSVSVNIILAPIFIFIFNWGMFGAALATLLAETAACVWLIHHFATSKGILRFRQNNFVPHFDMWLEILRLGLPPCLMNACACLVVIVVNRQLLAYGGDLAIGAYGIFNTLVTLFFMVVMGITHGMQPIIGYNHGAGSFDRVRRTVKLGVFSGSAITCLGFLVLELAPIPLAGIFTDNADLLGLAEQSMRLGAMLFFLVGAQVVITASFQFIGMAFTASALSLARQMLFLIPALLILPLWLGLDGIWYSIPLSDALAVLLTFVVWRRAKHRLGF